MFNKLREKLSLIKVNEIFNQFNSEDIEDLEEDVANIDNAIDTLFKNQELLEDNISLLMGMLGYTNDVKDGELIMRKKTKLEK